MPRDADGVKNIPRASDGTYSLPTGSIVNTGDTILPSQHNPPLQDIAQALSNSIDRDGKGGMRAPLDMGGNPVRNVGAGSNPTDGATVAQAAAGGVPIGAVLDYAGSVAPASFLLCAGQAVSRTDYADLFTAIGLVYGVGDGALTFNIPDMRGRVGAGKDDMGGTVANRLTALAGGVNGAGLGQIGGEQAHVLLTSELAAHAHTGATAVDGVHSHNLNGWSGAANNAGGSAGFTDVGTANSQTTATDGAHSHAFTTDMAGSNVAHNNVQPTLILNKIIKAKVS